MPLNCLNQLNDIKSPFFNLSAVEALTNHLNHYAINIPYNFILVKHFFFTF